MAHLRFPRALLAIGLLLQACESKKEFENFEIAKWKTDLLEVAFTGASKYPIDPHIKSRSKTQSEVVDAALELDQPLIAQRYIASIANWRAGVGYADLALWCFENGFEPECRRYLALAEERIEGAKSEGAGQGWRADRIRAHVARVYRLLEDDEQVAKFGKAIEEASEQVHLSKVLADTIPASQFDDEIARVERALETKEFDAIRAALTTCVHLYDRFYTDAAKREQLHALVTESKTKLPLEIRIDFLLELSDAASRHDDKDEAARIVKSTTGLLHEGRWLPENEVPLRARVAIAMARAGDPTRARSELETTEQFYEDKLDTIVDIYRGQCLRAIAEAWQALGDHTRALAAYARAAEAGTLNPNSRPRADDLAATCCSLAITNCEPDAALWKRLEEIRDGLGDPW
ncbi:MAG: hypothetical protein H6832_17825 [Planctomycetes bacterium]|nr:hypothetical protein [Planctomycetota bacterium]MCB9920266.1 hypothetical protein [Planctomycetota bacterium]